MWVNFFNYCLLNYFRKLKFITIRFAILSYCENFRNEKFRINFSIYLSVSNESIIFVRKMKINEESF